MNPLDALGGQLRAVRAAIDAEDAERAAALFDDYQRALMQLRPAAGDAAALAALRDEHDAVLELVRRQRDAAADALGTMDRGRRQSDAYRRCAS